VLPGAGISTQFAIKRPQYVFRQGCVGAPVGDEFPADLSGPVVCRVKSYWHSTLESGSVIQTPCYQSPQGFRQHSSVLCTDMSDFRVDELTGLTRAFTVSYPAKDVGRGARCPDDIAMMVDKIPN
jgi:hypothetical protein